MSEDVMDWLRRQQTGKPKVEFLSVGAVLTWTIVQKNIVVNEVRLEQP